MAITHVKGEFFSSKHSGGHKDFGFSKSVPDNDGDGMAKGGSMKHQRLPRSMKSAGLQPHSPVNTPPRNPMMTQTPTGDTPGGVVPYGVQPSVEPGAQDGAGPAPTVPATGMKKGGRLSKPSVKQRY